jgi:MFS family permease
MWWHEYDGASREDGWKPATIGMMLSAFSLGYLILQPIGGWIADKAGARRTLAGTMAGWSRWVLLTPLAPTVLWLTATFRVLLGAFEAPYIPASVTAVARASPLRREDGIPILLPTSLQTTRR